MDAVDTTVWVDYFRGTSNAETDYLDRALFRGPIALLDLVACEVLQGVRTPTEHEAVLRLFSKLTVISSAGLPYAIAASDNFRLLRSRGITVRKTIDCLIATQCIQGGHALLHRDRDFDPFEQYLGLRVIHP